VRFVDNTLSFINIHEEDLLTQVNTMFPQFGHVIFDKNSPVEETKKMAFYESLQSGLMKLKSGSQADLVFTHPKYSPIRSSVLAASVSAGALTLDLLTSLQILLLLIAWWLLLIQLISFKVSM